MLRSDGGARQPGNQCTVQSKVGKKNLFKQIILFFKLFLYIFFRFLRKYCFLQIHIFFYMYILCPCKGIFWQINLYDKIYLGKIWIYRRVRGYGLVDFFFYKCDFWRHVHWALADCHSPIPPSKTRVKAGSGLRIGSRFSFTL